MAYIGTAAPMGVGSGVTGTVINQRESNRPFSNGFSKSSSIGPTSSAISVPSNTSNFLNMIYNNAAKNNATSAAQAAELRTWQEEQNRKAMDFNANQAALNRNWQEYMSNTSHQREMADLKAAGLNPVLTAMGGNGAAVTAGSAASGVTSQGAKGDVDTSGNAALVSVLSAFLQNQTELQKMNVTAMNNLAVADKYTEMNKYVADLQSATSLNTTSIMAAASKYAADRGADASKTAAAISAAAARYGYDVSSFTAQEVARFNAEVNLQLQREGFAHDFDVRAAFPTTNVGALGSVMELIGNAFGGEGRGMQNDVSWSDIWNVLSGKGNTQTRGSGFGSETSNSTGKK